MTRVSPGDRLTLTAPDGAVVGWADIDDAEPTGVSGRFQPGPGYPPVAELFRQFGEYVDDATLTLLPATEAEIERLGLRVGRPGEDAVAARAVQIFSDGVFACRVEPPVAADGPVAPRVASLVTADGREVGFLAVRERDQNLLLGTFTPGRDYPTVEPLFRVWAEVVEENVLSVLDDADGAIAALGIRLADGTPVWDVQIYPDGAASVRVGARGDRNGAH